MSSTLQEGADAYYVVGVYWGMREESRQACAERISAFLIALANQDAALSQWFEQVYSVKQPRVPVPTAPERIAPLLEVNRLDFGRRDVIPELGFSFSAWDGRADGVAASLGVSCGTYSSVVPNSAVVSFDPQAALSLELLRGILRSAVAAFDPDKGVVTSMETARAQGGPTSEAPALYRYRRGVGFSEG
jgi:hypothetical protein